jgi:hypothetical protein
VRGATDVGGEIGAQLAYPDGAMAHVYASVHISICDAGRVAPTLRP